MTVKKLNFVGVEKVKNLSDEEVLIVALIENLQRKNLNPLEEAIAYKNLVAVQFHPEKSGNPGLRILQNFSRWVP